MRYKIIVVGFDKSDLDILSREFKINDWGMVSFSEGRTIFEYSRVSGDLLIVSSELKDMALVDFCRSFRESGNIFYIPLVVVGQPGNNQEVIDTLNAGADEYIITGKNFSDTVSEIIARLKAIIRRREYREQKNILLHGEIKLDENNRTVRVKNKVVRLTRKEFDLLYFFMRHPGRVVSREEILDVVWGYTAEMNTKTLDVYISRLRKRLGPTVSRLILPVSGIGYRFGK